MRHQNFERKFGATSKTDEISNISGLLGDLRNSIEKNSARNHVLSASDILIIQSLHSFVEENLDWQHDLFLSDFDLSCYELAGTTPKALRETQEAFPFHDWHFHLTRLDVYANIEERFNIKLSSEDKESLEEDRFFFEANDNLSVARGRNPKNRRPSYLEMYCIKLSEILKSSPNGRYQNLSKHRDLALNRQYLSQRTKELNTSSFWEN